MTGAVAERDSNTVSMFERLAKDPAVDVTKLEKLMELQERAIARDAKAQFVSAMAAAQAEMKAVATDSDNPQTRSRYASYEALDRALRPVYSKHGFALSYDTDDSPKPEHVRVLCEVMHIGGHSKTYHADMPADGKGAKGGDVMTKTHAVGSAMSYGQRYLLKGIFNVRVGESDDDGNSASALPTITVQQACLIDDLIADVGADRNRFLRYLKVGSVDEIPQQAFKDAVAALEAKRRVAK